MNDHVLTIAGKSCEEWAEFAKRDDYLSHMVPSDLRMIIESLRANKNAYAAAGIVRLAKPIDWVEEVLYTLFTCGAYSIWYSRTAKDQHARDRPLWILLFNGGQIGRYMTFELAKLGAISHWESARSAPAPTQGDAPAWKGLKLYNPDEEEMVQVLCRVLPDTAGEFPRSSDFPISSGDHAVGDLFVSIGFRDNDGHWYVAGWDMTQECFTDARLFDVLAWQPMASTGQNALPKKGGAA